MNWTRETFSDGSGGPWYQYDGRSYQATIARDRGRYRWGVWLAGNIDMSWGRTLAGGTCSNLQRAQGKAQLAICEMLRHDYNEVRP